MASEQAQLHQIRPQQATPQEIGKLLLVASQTAALMLVGTPQHIAQRLALHNHANGTKPNLK